MPVVTDHLIFLLLIGFLFKDLSNKYEDLSKRHLREWRSNKFKRLMVAYHPNAWVTF